MKSNLASNYLFIITVVLFCWKAVYLLGYWVMLSARKYWFHKCSRKYGGKGLPISVWIFFTNRKLKSICSEYVQRSRSNASAFSCLPKKPFTSWVFFFLLIQCVKDLKISFFISDFQYRIAWGVNGCPVIFAAHKLHEHSKRNMWNTEETEFRRLP